MSCLKNADLIIFDWVDTKEVRPENSKAYALINDSENKVSNIISEALSNYDIKPILWSHREKIKLELAA
ncbi:MAG: DUF1829 domain-containing protein [Legionellales bacterium]|nr:DUF1829 domain-containing protein [Legionellales bacterium]